MKLIQHPIDHFRQHPKAVRIHRPHNIESLVNSIRCFGQILPVMSLPDGTLLKGHGVLLAARILKFTKLWTIERLWSPEEAEAIMMLDNRITESSEWEMTSVIDFLKRLGRGHTLIPTLGWTPTELEILFMSEFTPKATPEVHIDEQQAIPNDTEYVWTGLYDVPD